MNFKKRFLDLVSKSAKSDSKSSKLRFEALENREMLAASNPIDAASYADFDAIAAEYSGLSLAAQKNALRVAEFTDLSSLSAVNINDELAANNREDVLFVFKTTGDTTIQLGESLKFNQTNQIIVKWGQGDLKLVRNGGATIEYRSTVSVGGFTFDGSNVGDDCAITSKEYDDTLTIDGCTFSNLVGGFEGAAINAWGSLFVSNSQFLNNSSIVGPAILASGAITVENSVFKGNKGEVGGAVDITPSPNAHATFKNSLFVENGIEDGDFKSDGGAIFIDMYNGTAETTNTDVVNCTFANNIGVDTIAYTSNITVVNSILTDDNSLGRRGQNPSVTTGVNNLSTFTNWEGASVGNILMTESPFADNSYELRANSEATNAGSNSDAASFGITANSVDLAGNSRIDGNTIDIGAYEFQFENFVPESLTIVVTSSSDDAVDHSDDFNLDGTPNKITLRDAIDYLGMTYNPNNWGDDYNGFDYSDDAEGLTTIVFAPGVINVTLDAQLNIDFNCTIDGGDNGVTISANDTRHFYVGDAALNLKKLTLQGGNGTLGDTGLLDNLSRTEQRKQKQQNGFGGSIFVTGSGSVYTTDVSFENNGVATDTKFYGGAVYNKGLFVANNKVTFTNNKANLGGAIFNAAGGTVSMSGDGILLTNNSAVSNASGQYGSGGAVYNSADADRTGTLTLNGVDIKENSATKYGGGIANYGLANLTKVHISQGKAQYGGGLMTAGNATLTAVFFSSCSATVSGSKGGYGGGIYACSNTSSNTSGNLTIVDSIDCYYNTASYAGAGIDVVSGKLSFNFGYGANDVFAFRENVSGNMGGAIVVGTDASQLYFNRGVVGSTQNHFMFIDNQAKGGFAPTVAVKCNIIDAKSIVEGFGFDYESVSSQHFETFQRYDSSTKDKTELSFEYLAGTTNYVSNPDSISVLKADGEFMTLTKGQAVSFDALGFGGNGTHKLTYYFNEDSEHLYELILDRSTGLDLILKRIELANDSHNTQSYVGFSIKSISSPISAIEINWGDGQTTTQNAYSFTANAFHFYGLQTKYDVSIKVTTANGTKTIDFSFDYTAGSKDTVIDPLSEAELDQVFLTEEMVDELFEF